MDSHCVPVSHMAHASLPQAAQELDGSAGVRALLVTMHTRTDTIPIDVMLPHQLRMLSLSQTNIADTIVLENNAPWQRREVNSMEPSLRRQGAPALRRVVEAGLARVVNVNYTAIKGQLLDSLFAMHPRKFGRFTLSRLLDAGWPVRNLAYIAGVATFLHQCKIASDSIDLCIYLDSDIFLYRSGPGLVELAAPVFERNPTFVVLQPPTLCESHVRLRHANGFCAWHPHRWSSSRHMIFNRSRLVRVLPLAIPVKSIVDTPSFGPWNARGFEALLSSSLGTRYGIGRLNCGGDAFAIHPDNEHPPREERRQNRNHTARELALQIIERIEAGRFELPRYTRAALSLSVDQALLRGIDVFVDSVWTMLGCRERVAGNLCHDMAESEVRIRRGFAW
eukprot:TRINITY_DN55818_c0_g1_i1.p1 TRINITY_DN55818_c0_g1~~TRINITY_DN55818_c0_g1_i1.p1  ORF type:complete len:393 (+),score=42.87 TRINITY_DN55818_c0_g1_i1:98-1276(+)